MSTYSSLMSIRKLFAILVAIAVLFAPSLTGAGMAQAAVPEHHAQMMEKGHCDPASDGKQNKAAEKTSCCGAMCMAVAVTSGANSVTNGLLGNGPVSRLHSFRTGSPAELATPPPRAA